MCQPAVLMFRGISPVISNVWLGTSSRSALRKPWNATKCIHHAGLLSVGLNSAPVRVRQTSPRVVPDTYRTGSGLPLDANATSRSCQ